MQASVRAGNDHDRPARCPPCGHPCSESMSFGRPAVLLRGGPGAGAWGAAPVSQAGQGNRQSSSLAPQQERVLRCNHLWLRQIRARPGLFAVLSGIRFGQDGLRRSISAIRGYSAAFEDHLQPGFRSLELRSAPPPKLLWAPDWPRSGWPAVGLIEFLLSLPLSYQWLTNGYPRAGPAQGAWPTWHGPGGDGSEILSPRTSRAESCE
jgi:hypothetical protein